MGFGGCHPLCTPCAANVLQFGTLGLIWGMLWGRVTARINSNRLTIPLSIDIAHILLPSFNRPLQKRIRNCASVTEAAHEISFSAASKKCDVLAFKNLAPRLGQRFFYGA